MKEHKLYIAPEIEYWPAQALDSIEAKMYGGGGGTGLTKTVVRDSMIAFSEAADAIGLHLAAQCLYNSCQDSPSPVTYESGSWQSNEVASTPAFQSMISSLEQTLLTCPSNSFYETSSQNRGMTLSSPTDVFLALNKVYYGVNATNTNGTWTIMISVYDTYDFNPNNWQYSGSITSDMADIK